MASRRDISAAFSNRTGGSAGDRGMSVSDGKSLVQCPRLNLVPVLYHLSAGSYSSHILERLSVPVLGFFPPRAFLKYATNEQDPP